MGSRTRLPQRGPPFDPRLQPRGDSFNRDAVAQPVSMPSYPTLPTQEMVDPQQAIVQETQTLMQQLEQQITSQLSQKELPPNEKFELLRQLQQLRTLQQQAAQLQPTQDQSTAFSTPPQPVNDQQMARQNILSLLQNSLASAMPSVPPAPVPHPSFSNVSSQPRVTVQPPITQPSFPLMPQMPLQPPPTSSVFPAVQQLFLLAPLHQLQWIASQRLFFKTQWIC